MIKATLNPNKKPSAKDSREIMQSFYPHFPKPSQIKTFNAQYGKTIATWQLVEANLYEVYRSVTMARRPGAEAAAFYSVPSFRTQLNLTNAAISFALHDNDKLLTEWQSIFNKATKKANKRNEIAHGSIIHSFTETNKEWKVYVGPIATDPRTKLPPKQPNNKPEPLTLKRLKEYEKDFRNLAVRLRQFSRNIPQP